MSTYKRDPVQTPKLSGTPLKLFVEALESPLGNPLLGKITRDSGLERFRQASADGASPQQVPLPLKGPVPSAISPGQAVASLLSKVHELPGPFQPETAAHFALAYRRQGLTPTEVARRVIAAVGELGKGEGSLHCFIASSSDDIRAQAEASTRRFREGAPLGPLDGVPVAVKDELDQLPYPTTVGTAFLGHHPARQDATLVARLRAAGALLIGKTNMHEVGINPIGINPHHGAARNPHSRERITGGSSSGSAAAVAAGMCPIAIGADGGGSIRIPASLCGVVGLKATFGRVSEHGVHPLCWSVGHVGPLGATVRDVAAAYALIAGPDPQDAGTLAQPPVHLDSLEDLPLSGLRLGVASDYFRDADPEVVQRCEEALAACVRAGATRVEIPPPDLNTELWSHAVIILTEMAASLQPHIKEDVRRFGFDVRTNLSIARYFSGTDYVHALRHRQQLTFQYLRLMNEVDVIVTPSTACVAPPIPEQALPDGQSDLKTTDALMRFARAANLTGFPALSVPAGYDAAGLPVGIQFMGRPWEEALLLRLGLAVEAQVERRRPALSTRLVDPTRCS